MDQWNKAVLDVIQQQHPDYKTTFEKIEEQGRKFINQAVSELSSTGDKVRQLVLFQEISVVANMVLEIGVRLNRNIPIDYPIEPSGGAA